MQNKCSVEITKYKSKTPLLLKDMIDFLVLSSHFFLKAELTIADGLLWEDHKEADIGVSANMRMRYVNLINLV